MAAAWCSRTVLRLGREKETGRSLLAPGRSILLLMVVSTELVSGGFLQLLVMTVWLNREWLAVAVEAQGLVPV